MREMKWISLNDLNTYVEINTPFMHQRNQTENVATQQKYIFLFGYKKKNYRKSKPIHIFLF